MSVPAPLPETMINSNPKFYFESIMRRAMGSAALSNFDNLEWVRDYIEPYLDPEQGLDRIAAACEDVSWSFLSPVLWLTSFRHGSIVPVLYLTSATTSIITSRWMHWVTLVGQDPPDSGSRYCSSIIHASIP